MFYIRSKNIFLHQNYLGALKLSKQKKFWKFSEFFFWTVYRMRGAMVGRNFSPIGEYSSTVKNRQKWASVHRCVGLKGLKKVPDSVPDDVKTLLQKFPSILRTGDVKPTPNHRVEHHIHTSSQPPVFAKSHRLDPEKLQIAKAEFKRLESAGIIRRSKSPWASPLHMVP